MVASCARISYSSSGGPGSSLIVFVKSPTMSSSSEITFASVALARPPTCRPPPGLAALHVPEASGLQS